MQGQGLDSLINKKVDAYRGNPQALENRYLQNKQLEDLLALQKIKSDKEAAKRQMKMSVPQNPDTIAAQREQEVLAMTKEEMAQHPPNTCLLYTSPSPRDGLLSRMPSSA